MKKSVLILLMGVFLFSGVYGQDYYVSPTGSASWSECTNINSPCSLSTMNAYIAAGDTAFLRGGTYTVSSTAISPMNSGTALNKITIKAYTAGAWADREEVIIISSDNSVDMSSFFIDQKQYIVVSGIKFYEFRRFPAIIRSNYIEVSYNTFSNLNPNSRSITPFIIRHGIRQSGGSSHNWIHNNILEYVDGTQKPEDLCYEGGDLLYIGNMGIDEGDSRHNTIENNIFRYAGHATTDDYGMYNVWRNNIHHNEGHLMDTRLIYGTATGGSASSLIDTSKNFVEEGVQVGWRVSTQNLNQIHTMGAVTSITTTINPNDTVNYTHAVGQWAYPSFSNGIRYGIGPCPYIPAPPGSIHNGKYSHRNAGATTTILGGDHKYSLRENEQFGFAGTNPNNRGSDGFSLGAGGILFRYNTFVANEGHGVIGKSYTGTHAHAKNSVFINNVFYKNGHIQISAYNVAARAAIFFHYEVHANNRFKNNIFWDNYQVYVGGYRHLQEWGNNLCNFEDATLGCVALGDPLFVNSDITDPLNYSLPNLRLSSLSPARNAGGHLTEVHSDDSGSGTTLIVKDANYFQDGTWGSDLARGVTFFPDWIVVGEVNNIVEISSIDYENNVITLANSINRNVNDPVWLYKKSDGERVLYGSAPDIGAYEYVSGDYIPPVEPPQPTYPERIITLQDMLNSYQDYRQEKITIETFLEILRTWIIFR